MPGEKRKLPQAFRWGFARQVKTSFGVADMAIGILKNGKIKRILVAEIMIDHPLVGAGAAGDDIDSSAGQTFCRHLAAGRFKDRGTGSFRVSHLGRRAFAFGRWCFFKCRIEWLALCRFFHFSTRLTMLVIGVPM